MNDSKYIVGIEIGSSKIKAAVGSVERDGSLCVLAVEEEKILDSVRYGLIRNVELVASSLGSLLQRLERRFEPRRIEAVYAAVGGIATRTIPVEVDRQLPTEVEITPTLIEQLKQEALNKGVTGRDIIGIAPRACYIDRNLTEHPEGTYGQHIKLALNLIVAKPQAKCNLNRVVADKLGLTINSFVIRQLSEADLVLSSEEKRTGVVFVDFGAETTTVSVYMRGNLQMMQTIPLGSRNITRDLMGIHHLEERAEEIKVLGGSAIPSSTTNIDSRLTDVELKDVNNFVSARSGEIIANIKASIEASGIKFGNLHAGMVVVGGGAKLRNFTSRLEAETRLKVRTGYVGNSVRIADGRIEAGDAVDIISVLWAAAPVAAECMPEPKVVLDPVIEHDELAEEQPDVDAIRPPVEENIDETIIERRPLSNEPIHSETQSGGRRGFFSRFSHIADKVGILLTGTTDVDDDDYEDDDDDDR